MTIFVSFWLLLIGILYASIFLGGFVKQWGADYTLTLMHHKELWAHGFSSGGWPSFFNSLFFSFIAAPLTAIIGILIAYVLTRKKFVGHGVIDFGTILIFAVPGTVTGIAYIMAFNTAPLELTGTAVILIITMSIRAMPVGIRGGMSALSTVSAVIFLASAGTNVATTYILSRVESGDNGIAVAYGSVLILTMLFFTLFIEFITGRSRVDKQI